MAVREKNFVPDKIYFITFSTFRWQKLFTIKERYSLIFKWFDYQKENYGNLVHGFVIMPDHFHGLIYISKNSPPISKLIQNAKRFLAYEIVTSLKNESNHDILNVLAKNAQVKKGAKHKVFSERYDSKLIEDAKMFWKKLDYIHNNPCKGSRPLSPSPEGYLLSSASNYLLNRGIYEVQLIY
ncbi:MAG: transposase [Deltaproteobacteria bacterium]|nr:transposase [Deltaproteobacteria bacterium]